MFRTVFAQSHAWQPIGPHHDKMKFLRYTAATPKPEVFHVL